MLVLTRHREETILIGDSHTIMATISPLEEQALRQCTEPNLLELIGRLLANRGPIEVTTVDIRWDKIRLGITAPNEMPVHRREVYDEIRREKAAKLVKVNEGECKCQTTSQTN